MRNSSFMDELKTLNPVTLVLFACVIFVGKRAINKYKERVNVPINTNLYWW